MPVYTMPKMSDFKFQSINALEFANIWNRLDESRTGTIEGTELDAFFYELAKYMLDKEPTQEEFARIKNKFNTKFGTSDVITMETLAKILLTSDEQFLLIFRKNISLKSSVTFMQIWRKYDQNSSGYLNVQELQSFVRDYISAANRSEYEEKIEDYAKSIMLLFDHDHDGMLDLHDMARLLNVEENFLLQFKIKNESQKQRRKDFEKIFKHYDQSRTGSLEGSEVDGFIKDMIETMQGPIQARDLDKMKETLLDHMDLNKDGKLQKSELAMYIGVHPRKQKKGRCIFS